MPNSNIVFIFLMNMGFLNDSSILLMSMLLLQNVLLLPKIKEYFQMMVSKIILSLILLEMTFIFTVQTAYEHSRKMNICVCTIFFYCDVAQGQFGQVFKEGTNTERSKLKKLCQSLVKYHYRSDLFPFFEGGGQEKYYSEVSGNVERLLAEDSPFLCSGVDEEVKCFVYCFFFQELVYIFFKGRTNNLCHPCLRDTCLDFYYGDTNPLARHFPDLFTDSIPDNCVVMAITVVYSNKAI